jgi:hypothetical protein
MALTYRCTVLASYADGTLVEPSMHYLTDVPTGGDEPAADDVASGFWGVVGTAFLAALPTWVTVHSVEAREEVEHPGVDVPAVGQHNVGSAGGLAATGENLPRALCPWIKLTTGQAIRSARGGFHMASPGEIDYVSNRLFISSFMSKLNDLAAVCDNSFDLGSVFVTHVNPVIYSRTRRARGESTFTFKVTGAQASNVPRYLRSRDTSP